MKSAIFTIMKKELARFFGDKRMAVTTILLPGLMIFIMYNFIGSAITNQFSVDDTHVSRVSVSNLPESVKQMGKLANMEFTEIDTDEIENAKTDITNSELDLCMVFPKDFDKEVSAYEASSGKASPNVEIYYNSTSTESQSAYTAMTGLLDKYEASMINKFDINNSSLKYDLADEKDTTAMIFSSMLPMLLLIFLFSGCMAVAPESIAGEKERGTIATMLITPTKRSNIAIGKIIALSIIALLSGISSATGTILSLPKLMGGLPDGMYTNVYTVADYTLLGVVILSTVLVMITLISIISAFAKTIKEAQTYVTPLMILVVLVGVSGMFSSGAKTDLYYYMIPVYNSVQCMTGIFSFSISTVNVIVTVVSNIIYTGLGVFILAKMFNSEKVIFSR